MKAQFKKITPAMAAKWLEANTGNRRVRKSLVDLYAKDMREGRWLKTHQGVLFSSSGRLLDGQHRLMAIVQSGATVEMLVTTGADDSAFPGIDINAVRTVADFMLGQPYRCQVAAAARHLYLVLNGHGYLNSKASPSKPELLAFIDAHPEIRESAEDAIESGLIWRSLGSQAFQLYFFHLAKDHPKCREFMSQVADGAELRKGSVPHVLRERILCGPKAAHGKRDTPKERQFIYVRAWKAFRDGRRVTKLQLPRGYQFESADFDPRVPS